MPGEGWGQMCVYKRNKSQSKWFWGLTNREFVPEEGHSKSPKPVPDESSKPTPATFLHRPATSRLPSATQAQSLIASLCFYIRTVGGSKMIREILRLPECFYQPNLIRLTAFYLLVMLSSEGVVGGYLKLVSLLMIIFSAKLPQARPRE